MHGHGEPHIDFMQDAKLCVLNGRLNPEIDNYTCISPRGAASVVDYIITPHDVYVSNLLFLHNERTNGQV